MGSTSLLQRFVTLVNRIYTVYFTPEDKPPQRFLDCKYRGFCSYFPVYRECSSSYVCLFHDGLFCFNNPACRISSVHLVPGHFPGFFADLDLPGPSQHFVRIVSLQLPVEGHLSLFAARAATAASGQSGDLAFHERLMGSKLPLSEELVFRHAETAGLDVATLRTGMKDPGIQDYLLEVRDLAVMLGVEGVPTYVVDGHIIHGPVTEQEILDLLADVPVSTDLNI